MEDDFSKYISKVEDGYLSHGINMDLVEKESIQLTDNFICVICLNLVWNPVFCEESDCAFCKNCIEAWNKKDKNCPNCRKEFKANTKVSRIVKNMLYKVKLKCNYISSGCNEILDYEKFENHYNLCDFGFFACVIPGCGFKAIKKEVLNHVRSCEFREIKCEFCNLIVKNSEIIRHYKSICKNYKKLCPVCKENITNSEMSIHNNGDCFEELSNAFLVQINSKEETKAEFLKDYEETKSKFAILNEKLKNIEEENKILKLESSKKDGKIKELLEDIMKIKSSQIISNNNNNQGPRPNVNVGSVGPNNVMCNNNLHNFMFLRQGIADNCSKCKKEISCRFQCRTCKALFCYKCNLPTEKLKCPVGHNLVKLKRDLPFYCDLCFDYYQEGSPSYCDKECDIDICEKCYKNKDRLISKKLHFNSGICENNLISIENY